MSLRYIASDGTVYDLRQGPRGASGPRGFAGADGADGASAYDLWLANGNTGTLTDFFRDIAPDITPSRLAASTGGPSYTVPTQHALVTLDVTAPSELSFADFVSTTFGTNPEGYSFTLHLTGNAGVATFGVGVVVHGALGGNTDAWATVIREDGAWHVLVGVAT